MWPISKQGLDLFFFQVAAVGNKIIKVFFVKNQGHGNADVQNHPTDIFLRSSKIFKLLTSTWGNAFQP